VSSQQQISQVVESLTIIIIRKIIIFHVWLCNEMQMHYIYHVCDSCLLHGDSIWEEQSGGHVPSQNSHWDISFLFILNVFLPEHSTTDHEFLQCHVKIVTVKHRIPWHRGATTWSLVGFRTVMPSRPIKPSLTHSRLYQSVSHSWTHVSLFLIIYYFLV
jgi:hypothetical protein